MRQRNRIALIVLVICCAIAIAIVREMIYARKAFHTYDIIGKITVALSNSVGQSPLPEYDPVAECRKRFPELNIRDGSVLDEWGNPIRISIKKLDDGFQATIVSGGPDGIIGTKDDLTKVVEFHELK